MDFLKLANGLVKGVVSLVVMKLFLVSSSRQSRLVAANKAANMNKVMWTTGQRRVQQKSEVQLPSLGGRIKLTVVAQTKSLKVLDLFTVMFFYLKMSA